MKFAPAMTNENYPMLRMLSENAAWECGVRAMLFGYRVSANPVGNGAYTIDYCCADEQLWVELILSIVVIAFETLPETLTSEEVQQLFPQQNIKPIKNDADCFSQLKQLAFSSYLEKSKDK